MKNASLSGLEAAEPVPGGKATPPGAKAQPIITIYGTTKELAEKLIFLKGTAYLAAASIGPYVNALPLGGRALLENFSPWGAW